MSDNTHTSASVTSYLKQLDIPQGIKQSQSRIAIRLLALVEAEQDSEDFLRQYLSSSLANKAKYIEAVSKLANIPTAKSINSNILTATVEQNEQGYNGIAFSFQSGVDPEVTDALYRNSSDEDDAQDEFNGSPIQSQGATIKHGVKDQTGDIELHPNRISHSPPPVDKDKAYQPKPPHQEYPIDMIDNSDIDDERRRIAKVMSKLQEQSQS